MKAAWIGGFAAGFVWGVVSTLTILAFSGLLLGAALLL